jgi:hypothetical protein
MALALFGSAVSAFDVCHWAKVTLGTRFTAGPHEVRRYAARRPVKNARPSKVTCVIFNVAGSALLFMYSSDSDNGRVAASLESVYGRNSGDICR